MFSGSIEIVSGETTSVTITIGAAAVPASPVPVDPTVPAPGGPSVPSDPDEDTDDNGGLGTEPVTRLPSTGAGDGMTSPFVMMLLLSSVCLVASLVGWKRRQTR